MHTENPSEGFVAIQNSCNSAGNVDDPNRIATCGAPPPKAAALDEANDTIVSALGERAVPGRLATSTSTVPQGVGPGNADRSNNSGRVAYSAPADYKGSLNLADAVAFAVLSFPEVRISEERVREAKAGVKIAEAALYPSADLRLAAGGNFSGTYEGIAFPYGRASNSVDGRLDGGLILRQLIFDFGATRFDIDRASALRDAERHKLREKIDETAAKTVQVFIRIHEQRALLNLVDQTIAAHQALLKVVSTQEREGHGTAADVSRIRSRLVDVGAIRADISLQLLGAENQFERLTRLRPKRLGEVPTYRAIIPGTPALAIGKVLEGNPRLAAMEASRKSTEAELEFQRRSVLPRFNIEVENESKNFRNKTIGRSQMEGRAMLAMRLRLLDGGLNAATEKQIEARLRGNELALLNEREQLEADIRQAYRAIESAQRKGQLVSEGVASSRKVRDLYLEQFKAGRRTIFELLDGHMAYYTTQRALIESRFDGVRAVYDVLRAMGELTKTLAKADTPRPPNIATKKLHSN